MAKVDPVWEKLSCSEESPVAISAVDTANTWMTPLPGTISSADGGAGREKEPPRMTESMSVVVSSGLSPLLDPCAEINASIVHAGSRVASSPSRSNSTKLLPAAARSMRMSERAASATSSSRLRTGTNTRSEVPPSRDDSVAADNCSLSSVAKFSPESRKMMLLLHVLKVVKSRLLSPSKVMPVATMADTPGENWDGSVWLMVSVDSMGRQTMLVMLVEHVWTAPASLGRSLRPIAFETTNVLSSNWPDGPTVCPSVSSAVPVEFD
mmetsp:Transcript_30087/g.50612  ORF Transcript_30087/g.50612 Transcript_30087/m.50612 type:complete len:266 (+) Transcript_30087:1652-2449(+)